MSEPARVFVSYSGDDWNDYVEPLATILRKNGINAVAANWDIQGGESLVQRILEEEIPQADAVVVVLSKSSVTKPWVIEELDHATVRRIVHRIKLIPFKIDDCTVPSSLQTLKRVSLRSPSEVEDKAREVIDAIYGHVQKPAIGSPPDYVSHRHPFPDLNRLEATVLDRLCNLEMHSGRGFFNSKELETEVEPMGIARSQLLKSLDRLHARHMIRGDRSFSGDYGNLSVQPRIASRFCRSEVPNYSEILREIVVTAANFEGNVMWTPRFNDQPHEVWFAYKTAFAELESRAAFKVTWGLGPFCVITDFSPFLEDWLEDM